MARDDRVGWLGDRMGRRARRRQEALPLYEAVVARARQPFWYLDGAVPDTVDGRFDMIAAVLSVVLIRLEHDDDGADLAARVTERFVDDMDGQLREIGIGDIVVGKHIGRMMGMLGGRLGAYRKALATPEAGGEPLAAALERNLYRGAAPDEAAVARVADTLGALHRALAALPVGALAAGTLP